MVQKREYCVNIEKNIKNIIIPVASLRLKYSINSNQETQCLYGEQVEIIKEEKNWSYCVTLNENYKGWIQNKSLGFLQTYTHLVSSLTKFIYSNTDYKSKILNVLFLNSKIRVLSEDNYGGKIELYDRLSTCLKKYNPKNKFKKIGS